MAGISQAEAAGPFDGRWKGEGKATPACAETAVVTFELKDGEFHDFLFAGPKGKTTHVKGRVTETGSAAITYGRTGAELEGTLQFEGDSFVGKMNSFCEVRDVSGQRVR